jgi:hypothetical protein
VSAMERVVAFPDGTLNDNFVTIARTHITLLGLLLSDLQFRINGSSNVSKSEEPKKKGRKPLHEAPQDILVDVPEFSSDLPMNEVTWPELVRRYLITLIEVEKYGDLTELKLEERKWLLRCLQGDGGVPCGAVYTVQGVESDAQVRESFNPICLRKLLTLPQLLLACSCCTPICLLDHLAFGFLILDLVGITLMWYMCIYVYVYIYIYIYI